MRSATVSSSATASVGSLDHGCVPCDAGEQLALERSLFDSQLACAPCVRLWQPLPALIVTSSEANLAGFAAAAARSRERGLPVVVRPSGGGAVCLGPGMLVVTQFHQAARNDIDGSYRMFAHTLMRAISSLGISIASAHVASAYCDGKFDLACGGLKVGGIAQRRRMARRIVTPPDGVALDAGGAYVWIHAVLAIERQALPYPKAVTEFYSAVGSPRIADPLATTCLAECLPPGASAANLLARCAAAITAAFGEPECVLGRSASGATWGPPSLPRSGIG